MSHNHSHGSGAPCACLSAPVPLQQSLTEVAFEKGLWGYILRGASATQIRSFIMDKAASSSDSTHKIANEKDSTGYTPLLYAARGGESEVCAVLIELGADVNATTPGLQQSSLHRAAAQGHVSTVVLLLAHGAERSLVDSAGRTALSYAEENGFDKVADILRVQ